MLYWFVTEDVVKTDCKWTEMTENALLTEMPC